MTTQAVTTITQMNKKLDALLQKALDGVEDLTGYLKTAVTGISDMRKEGDRAANSIGRLKKAVQVFSKEASKPIKGQGKSGTKGKDSPSKPQKPGGADMGKIAKEAANLKVNLETGVSVISEIKQVGETASGGVENLKGAWSDFLGAGAMPTNKPESQGEDSEGAGQEKSGTKGKDSPSKPQKPGGVDMGKIAKEAANLKVSLETGVSVISEIKQVGETASGGVENLKGAWSDFLGAGDMLTNKPEPQGEGSEGEGQEKGFGAAAEQFNSGLQKVKEGLEAANTVMSDIQQIGGKAAGSAKDVKGAWQSLWDEASKFKVNKETSQDGGKKQSAKEKAVTFNDKFTGKTGEKTEKQSKVNIKEVFSVQKSLKKEAGQKLSEPSAVKTLQGSHIAGNSPKTGKAPVKPKASAKGGGKAGGSVNNLIGNTQMFMAGVEGATVSITNMGQNFDGVVAKMAGTPIGQKLGLAETWENVKGVMQEELMPVIDKVNSGWQTMETLVQGAATAQQIYQLAVLGVKNASTIATAAQWAWNIALNANPIGLIVLGIAALIGIGILLYKNWDTIKLKATEVWGGIKNFISGVWEGIKEKTIMVWEFIKQNLGTIIPIIAGIILGPIGAVAGYVITHWEEVKAFMMEIWEGIRTKAFEIWEGIRITVENFVTGIVNKILEFKDKIFTTWEEIKAFISNPIKGVVEWFSKDKSSGKKAEDTFVAEHNAKGTGYWKGGPTWVHEQGGEIMDLPTGTRIYPHDQSVQMARREGMKTGKGIHIGTLVDKIADTVVIREDADIDRIADKMANKVKLAIANM